MRGKWLTLCGVASIAFLLLLPGPAMAKTIGFSSGDSMVFSYERYTTYPTPNGNYTTISMNQFTVLIDSINYSAPHGEVGYSETIQEFNNSVITNSTAYENFTTIFDPYDNLSYLGNIGFYPFTYADLPSGNVDNLGINVSTSDIPVGNTSETVSTIQHVNATVGRANGLIYVNMTTIGYSGETPSDWNMRFNSTTGILVYGRTEVNAISDIEGVYTYNLISYVHHTSPTYLAYIPYVIVVVIVIAIAASAIVRRKSEKEKKVSKMREKLS